MTRRLAPLLAALALAGCGRASSAPAASGDQGGTSTVRVTGQQAFSLPLRGLSPDERGRFEVGDSFFTRNWVEAPASTTGRDGLGPLFHARSCSACHLRDGRGAPPAGPEDDRVGALLRLSVAGQGPHGGPRPDPRYGGQLQPFAVGAVPPEGKLRVTWHEEPGTYADGTPYTLRRPHVEIVDARYGARAKDLRTSFRVAPHVVGMGLLEAIPEAQILARADPDDADGDGISGRPNRVWDVEAKAHRLGRFGWKANQPSVRQQVAGAFLGDMGITSPLFPRNNFTPIQKAAAAAPHGGTPEVSARTFDRVVFYAQTLAVPAQRTPDDAQVRAGRRLFDTLGCAACHHTSYVTGAHPATAALGGQHIAPYTDLLLHDMGPGLADGREDFEASGREWRTPPLWGLGLLRDVNGHEFLLHDGRARGMAEAILWHGGEAEASREAFRALDAAKREALLTFLRSL